MSVPYTTYKWLADNWSELIFSFGGVNKPDHVNIWFEEIASRYEERHRRYHTLHHVQNVLDKAFNISNSEYGYGKDIRKAELALYFHDVIYDPQRKDNEEESAEFAWKCLADLDFPETFITEIMSLVLVTKTHIPTTPYACLVVDADLGTLAIPHHMYVQYCEQVAAEYSFLDEATWLSGRCSWIESMLNKDRIFFTNTMQHKTELAKANLKNELEMWRLQQKHLGIT